MREKPKQKSFIRGGFYYNPEVETKVWRDCRSECTHWMGKAATRAEALDSAMTRARFARLEARARRRLLRGV